GGVVGHVLLARPRALTADGSLGGSGVPIGDDAVLDQLLAPFDAELREALALDAGDLDLPPEPPAFALVALPGDPSPAWKLVLLSLGFDPRMFADGFETL